MVKPNIGIINAIIRITIGFTMLSMITARLVRRPSSQGLMLMAMAAGMKIAEGITRYCPVTALLQQQMDQQRKNDRTNQSGEGNDDEAVVNPS